MTLLAICVPFSKQVWKGVLDVGCFMRAGLITLILLQKSKGDKTLLSIKSEYVHPLVQWSLTEHNSRIFVAMDNFQANWKDTGSSLHMHGWVGTNNSVTNKMSMQKYNIILLLG